MLPLPPLPLCPTRIGFFAAPPATAVAVVPVPGLFRHVPVVVVPGVHALAQGVFHRRALPAPVAVGAARGEAGEIQVPHALEGHPVGELGPPLPQELQVVPFLFASFVRAARVSGRAGGGGGAKARGKAGRAEFGPAGFGSRTR